MVSLYILVGLSNRNTCFTARALVKLFIVFLCINQCGITPDELLHKSPHAISVNSSPAVTTTQSTDTAMGSTKSDCEGSTVDPVDEN